jgi:acetyl esterase/lipase
MAYEFASAYFEDEIVAGRVMDILSPKKCTRDEALFFVHGGGWTGGARADYHPIMRAFNGKGFLCASTDYRLSGVTIGDQIMDIRHGYDLFLSYLKRERRPLRVFVHGSSAGAHLAALLTLALPGECGDPLTFRSTRYKNKWVRPVGAALQATPVRFEPWEDIFPLAWTAMQAAVGTPYEKNASAYRRLAPIHHISKESSPIFLLEAEDEHMFPLEYTQEFVEKMRAMGRRAEYKVYTRAEHGFFYDVTRRQQKEAFADILTFIDSLR